MKHPNASSPTRPRDKRGRLPLLAVGTLGIAAICLWQFWPTEHATCEGDTCSTSEVSAASRATTMVQTPTLLPGQVVLQGHFVEGQAKLYSVEETVTTIHEQRRSASGNVIFDTYVGDIEVAPTSLTRIEFVEAETCEELLDDGSAQIAYGVRSFAHSEHVDGEEVSSLRVQQASDLAALPQDRHAALVGSLMETPVRFRLTPDFAVSDLELPGAAGGASTDALLDEYERSLEARFRGFFPGYPVAPGDTWESELPLADSIAGSLYLGAERSTTLRATFEELVSYQGRDCARIVIDLDFGIAPGTSLARDTITELFVDELTGRTEVLYDVERGLVMQDRTHMTYAAHRVIGLEETEKIIVPFRIEKQVDSAFVGFDRVEG